MNDQEVLLLFKQGDREAFSLLYKKYWNQIYRFAQLYIVSNNDIEEVVQDVFIKLWDVRAFIREEDNFKGFLFIITRNIIFNKSRRKLNETSYKLLVLNALENDSFDMEEEISTHNLAEYIDTLIAQMPPRRQMIFNLSRKEGKTYKEIAEIMNISEKTVEKQITATLKYLKKNVILITYFLMCSCDNID